jgi:hypothetical protein
MVAINYKMMRFSLLSAAKILCYFSRPLLLLLYKEKLTYIGFYELFFVAIS